MERDERILEAAEKLFFERGFDGVGVDEIGQAAGVSGSAIYRHFQGKNEILSTLFDRAIDALLMGMPESGGDHRVELGELVRGFIKFAQTHRMLAGVWEREHRSLEGEHRRRYQRRQRQYVERWSNCLAKCYPGWTEDTLKTATRATQALMMSNATRSGGIASTPEIGSLLCDMALASLEALDTSARMEAPPGQGGSRRREGNT
ncbi:helix-turn-helix domain containing protein [Rhodococcus sp. T2V]|uniref:TetR/AcrR family transcriptional regulator n=1 Tax=Rhodococcus sp. T2V TaxID=3034164 RepID=UPI0023E1EB93|nr:TetR/AcrR family transcriptional regulator [Rhodococcus sp. T2V]MDF3305262.1 helix-turn-helix domain containing protein [Rhodococcus sp. T2V]